jgi:hypothetical protein
LDNYINPLKSRYVTPNKVPANVYGSWYSNYIKNLRANNTNEYVRLCGGKVTPKPDPKPWTCKGKCKIETDKLNCELTVTKPDGKSIQEIYSSNKSDFIGTDNKLLKGKDIEIAIEGNNTKKLICSVEIEVPKVDPPQPDNDWPKYTCESKCSYKAPPYDGKTCEVKITTLPGGAKKPTVETKQIELKSNEELDIKDPSGKKLTCTSTTPVSPKPKTYTCEASCVAENEPTEGGKKCDLTITSKDESGKEEITTENKTFSKGEALVFQPKDAEKAIACNEKKSVDPEVETSKPTIKVTAIEGKETYKVKAVKEKDNGWAFGWAIKGEKDVSQR